MTKMAVNVKVLKIKIPSFVPNVLVFVSFVTLNESANDKSKEGASVRSSVTQAPNL